MAGLREAVTMAEEAINANSSILSDFRLTVLTADGQCRSDIVMKSFINYYMRPDQVLGVLGPECSETVEPIAGKSCHQSAESSSTDFRGS